MAEGTRGPTPGQTVGPFFHGALPYPGDSDLVGLSGDTRPDAVRLHGTVYDGAGQPVPDALIELWQPDPTGAVVARPGSLRRDRSVFTGWGRAATDPAGRFAFTTLAPGPATPGRPAFFAVAVFARGLLDRLFTRAYLPTAQLDLVLAGLDERRRQTLLCTPDSAGYRFDIHLQGPRETVFLAYRDDYWDPAP